MLIDTPAIPDGSTIHVDVCIVGGGPAGIAVAVPYLDDPSRSVALLESGGTEFDEEVQELADAGSTGQAYFPMKETRIRAFGGSSMSYGGINAPLDTLDFETRSWVPLSGWSISRADLDPYYEDAKRVSEVINPDAVSAGAEGRFGDKHGPTPETRWAEIYFTAPARFGQMYAEKFRQAKNVSAFLYTTVLELETNESQTAIEGVHVAARDGSRFRVVANDYVIAGGGIENARLLLTSGNAERGGLANEHDVVGRYFQEHPRLYDRFMLPDDSSELALRVQGAAGTLNFSRLGLSDAAQRDESLLNYITNLSFGYAGQDTAQFQAVRRIANATRKPWSDSPYFQDVGGGPTAVRWIDVKTAMMRPHRAVQSALNAVLEPSSQREWIQIESNVEQTPRAENRVTLSDKRDPFGIPRAELHWTLAPEEEQTYRRGLELVVEALDPYALGMRDGRMGYSESWPDDVQGCWHHIGTTRMSDNPAEGVVDRDCRVHGVDNLYVAGSSVFPTGGATSPTLTIVALALRLAEHLQAKATTP